MDINDGALSFDAVINTSDLDKMTKVVEDKIIGMASNIEKESSKMGESFNSGMSSITKEVEKQKEIISSLEDQYNKIQKTLDNTSIDSGMEEDYLKAKQLLSEVNSELQEQRENLGFIEAAQRKATQSTESTAQIVKEVSRTAKEASKELSVMFHLPETADQFKEAINAQRKVLIDLQVEYKTTSDRISELKSEMNKQDDYARQRSGNQSEYNQLIKKQAELTDSRRAEQKELKELEKDYNKLISQQEKENQTKGETVQKTETYMSQLRKLREEMIGLELQGKKESPRYRELQVELENTGTAYRRVQQEQKCLTTAGSATISGLLSGMSAVSGAFSAGSGVVSLFVKDNEQLAAIQTKLQAAMAITIGLQQVSTALHSTSAFRMNVVTKVTNAFAVANTRLAVGLGISTVAAKALMATLTLGLSVAITGIIYLISKFSSEQSKAREEILKFNESVASSANGLRADFEKLRKEWELAGEDLKKKEKLVLKNGEAYDKLGVSITSVEDADRIFRDNAEEFEKSIIRRAKAAAAMDIAAEKYKESIQKMLDAEKRVDNPSTWDKVKGYMSWFGLQQSGDYSHSWDDMTKEWAKKGAEEDKAESNKLDKEAANFIAKALGWTDEDNKAIEAMGAKSLNKIDDFSKKYWESIRNLNQRIMDESLPKSDKFNEAKKKRDEAVKALQSWDKTPTKSANQLATLAQKKIEADQWLLNRQKELSNEQIKAELESEQKSLDLLKDSYDKRIKQNELNYRKELQSIKNFEANKEKAQQEAAKKIYTSENGGNDKGFDFSKFDMSKLPKGLRPEDIKEQVTRLATEVQAAWENADMLAYEEMTKDFMSFQQQKADVTKTYQDLITQYEKMGLSDRVALIKKERDQTLGELSSMEIQTSDLWKNLFQNMDNLSEKTIKDIIAKLRELVKNIEDVDIKTALTKQLDDAEQTVGNKNPFSGLKKGIEDYKKATDEASKNKAIKNIGQSAKDMSDIVNDSLGSVVNGLKDLGMMDEGTEQIFGDVMGLVGGMGDLAAGYASMNPAQMIQGTVGIITSAFSLFDSKSRDIEKKIKEHKKQLIELGRVYKDIEYQVNNAVGEDYYSEQFKAIENLKQQQKEVEGLLYQENRKKKKDRDDDAINSYKDQLADIPRQIKDIEREITETLVQTSFKDLSNQLADVLVSAFESGEDAAKDFDKTFNKVIANAVKNSLKLKVLDKPINEFTEALSEYMLDNNYSASGFNFDKWRNILKEAGEAFTSGLEEFEKFFDIEPNRQGATGGFAQASQDSINELNGLMYATRQMIGDIRNDNREDLLIQRSIVGYLITIAENTGHLKAVQQYLHNIDTYGIKMKP